MYPMRYYEVAIRLSVQRAMFTYAYEELLKPGQIVTVEVEVKDLRCSRYTRSHKTKI